jgi:hypothetical protein
MIIQQINETKSCFFEIIQKIDKPLTKLTKRRKEMTWINKIRGEKRDNITDTKEIKKIIWEYFKNLHSSKLEIKNK